MGFIFLCSDSFLSLVVVCFDCLFDVLSFFSGMEVFRDAGHGPGQIVVIYEDEPVFGDSPPPSGPNGVYVFLLVFVVSSLFMRVLTYCCGKWFNEKGESSGDESDSSDDS